jgi:CRP-like cAMP-binding protein
MDATDDAMADPARLRVLLARTEWFTGVPQEEIDQIVPHFRPRDVTAGTEIVRQGEPGDELFLVDSGQLEASVTANGKRIRLGTLAPGDVFGEMAVLRRAPRTATITALTAARLWVLSGSSLRQAFERMSGLEAKLRRIMRRRELANALHRLQ